MIEKSPWVVASKSNGQPLQQYGDRWSIHFRTAVHEIAVEQNELWEPKIGDVTIIMNLALGQGPYFSDIRRRLRKRIKQLKKENERHAHSKDKQTRSSNTV